MCVHLEQSVSPSVSTVVVSCVHVLLWIGCVHIFTSVHALCINKYIHVHVCVYTLYIVHIRIIHVITLLSAICFS